MAKYEAWITVHLSLLVEVGDGDDGDAEDACFDYLSGTDKITVKDAEIQELLIGDRLDD